MDPVELIGYAAVLVNIGVYLMRTMIPLRIFAVATNLLFIVYSLFAEIYPTLILNCILLPLNGYRLAEMLYLVRTTRVAATRPDFDLGFIRPYTTSLPVDLGGIVFKKGDIADSMYIVESGTFELPESGVTLTQGAVVGELGLLAPGGLRTQSLVCMNGGVLQQLSYDRFKQLFLQNPKFGFYFLQLTTGRLFQNIDALERTLEARGIPSPLARKRPA